MGGIGCVNEVYEGLMRGSRRVQLFVVLVCRCASG